MAVKIDTIMLRYFVPFSFSCPDDDSFAKAVKTFKDKYNSTTKKSAAEDDFFSNISSLYDENNPAGIGEFIEISDNLPKLESADRRYSIDITRCGVYLHKNGLGILWYEVKPHNSITNDVNTLYRFQNTFKELTIHNNPFKWQTAQRKKQEFSKESGEKRITVNSEEIISLAADFGLDMTGKFPEKGIVLENGKVIIEYTEHSEFHQGLWINELLNGLDNLHFMPERYKGENRIPIPDKALLCNYTLFSADSDEERMDYMFRMTSGYSESYNRIDNIDENCFIPFKNTWWYAKQEGIGQYVLIDDNPKRTAFHRDLAIKRMENYCYLYVLVLQQHYSLLEYSKRIGNLSTVAKNGKKHLKELHSCVDDMNIFFMKNTFPGISHISHQNSVYRYLRDIYDINEFFDETKNGLEAVTEMYEKYREERTSDRLFLCTIIGAVFVIAETLINFKELVLMTGMGTENSISQWIGIAVLLVISVIAALIVWGIWKGFKK